MKLSIVIPTYNRRHLLAGALEAVLADPARAEAMGVAGRERARRYDWPVVAGEIEKVGRHRVAPRCGRGGRG